MNKYRADIGTWERFSVYEFEAPNDKAALKLAFHRLKLYQEAGGNENADLVQIYCGNELVWDYHFNGRAQRLE